MTTSRRGGRPPPPGAPAKRERVGFILDLMRRGEFVASRAQDGTKNKDATCKVLAKRWGIPLAMVQDDASEASRTVILLSDPRAVRMEANHLLRKAAHMAEDVDAASDPKLVLDKADTLSKTAERYRKWAGDDGQEHRVRHIIETHLSRSEEYQALRAVLVEAASQFFDPRDVKLLLDAIDRFEGVVTVRSDEAAPQLPEESTEET